MHSRAAMSAKNKFVPPVPLHPIKSKDLRYKDIKVFLEAI